MALVAFLKGLNVGGHRRLRPTVLAKELKRFDVVNIGAAGTLVVRKRISRVELRAEILRRVPFEVDVMICTGSEVLRLVSRDPFEGHTFGRDIIPFVSVMARRRRLPSALPLNLPADGDWCLKVLTCQDRFVVGLHRREMKAIAYLGRLEKLLGVPLTTRNWNTILGIGRVL
jgi:uncharacterized protein (DUF1697 family)